MAGFQVTGTLYALFDEQQVRSLRKREFVLETTDNPQYPQLLKFDLLGERCGIIDGYQVGEQLEVFFNLKGREWTNQQGTKVFFTTLEAWKLQRPGAKQSQKGGSKTTQQSVEEIEGDEIPF